MVKLGGQFAEVQAIFGAWQGRCAYQYARALAAQSGLGHWMRFFGSFVSVGSSPEFSRASWKVFYVPAPSPAPPLEIV
eukprot:296869-Pelagomonas_calceolata.AAC.1